MINKVCVYCASSPYVDKVYFEAAEKLGKILAENKIHTNYGGGSVGLMGKLADTIIDNGGSITGIMPHFMRDIEWQHKRITEFVFVKNMQERKTKLLEGTDAVIALPGGIGTLEELLEAITLKRFGFYKKPIIIINTNNYYQHIKHFLENGIKELFMSSFHLKMWQFIDHPDELSDALNNSEDWSDYKLEMATIREPVSFIDNQ